LSEFGDVHDVAAGEALFREGERFYGLIVVLEGSVEIVYLDQPSGAETVIVTHGPGRFLGELSLFTGQRAVVHGRMGSDGRVLRIDQDGFRRLLAGDSEIGDTVFAAFMARREILREGVATRSIRIVGSRHSGRALDLVNYLLRQRVGHQWIDLDDDGVTELLADLGLRPAQTPIVVSGSAVLRNPTIGELASHLGLVYEATDLKVFDVVIVGAGPAGLAAAVYGASEGLETLLVDSDFIGGQAGTSSRIENYVGFPSGISGGDLVERAALQAQRLGARISSPSTVTRTRLEEVTITNNQTGASARQPCVGLFSFIGTSPSTSWLEGFVELDAKGFVLTDSDLGDVGFEPLPFETSRAGIFAAGDVRAQSMKRVAAAVGDGSSAIRSVHQRLAPATP